MQLRLNDLLVLQLITAVQNCSQFCDLITCEVAPPDGHPFPLQPLLCNVAKWACFITCVVLISIKYSFLAISGIKYRYKIPFHCVTNNRTCCLQQIALNFPPACLIIVLQSVFLKVTVLTAYLKGMLDTATPARLPLIDP